MNLAELYFESLEGADNPARFTPMNARCSRGVPRQHGFDPLTLFSAPGKPTPRSSEHFLTIAPNWPRRQQEEWIAKIEGIRESKPNLDFVLTHVDDRFDTRMRDLIGADAARVLPLLDQHDFTFLIEDPATIWNLGPERYPKIAEKYKPLTKQTDKLAIDINIVERYQDVYPTKQQTGTELFELVHVAAKSFPRVALYFENSILAPDLPLLSSAAACVDKVQQDGRRLIVDSPLWRGGPMARPGVGERQGCGRCMIRLHFGYPPVPNVIEPAAERSSSANAGLQRQPTLGDCFRGRPGIFLPKQRPRRGSAEQTPPKIGSRWLLLSTTNPGIRPQLRSPAPPRPTRSNNIERAITARPSLTSNQKPETSYAII